MRKTQSFFKQLGYWTSVATLGIILGISLQFVRAWTEPTALPPGGNLGAPLNTGGAGQYKEGGLIIRTSPATVLSPNGLIVQNGNVGIGTANPGAKLEVNGTVKSKISGTDAVFLGLSGVANEVATFGWSSGGFAYMQGGVWGGTTKSLVLQGGGGNVGIGTANPAQKLDVAGQVKATGLCMGADCKTSWVTRVETSVIVPYNTITAATATCPAGKKLVTCSTSIEGLHPNFYPSFYIDTAITNNAILFIRPANTEACKMEFSIQEQGFYNKRWYAEATCL